MRTVHNNFRKSISKIIYTIYKLTQKSYIFMYTHRDINPVWVNSNQSRIVITLFRLI